MDVSFFVNAISAILAVLAASILNLFNTEKFALHYRMAFLGFSLVVSMFVYCLWHLGFVRFSDFYLGLVAFFDWTTVVLYISFILDLTVTKRSRYFYLFYLLPFPLAVLVVFLPRPIGIYIVGSLAVAGLIVFSLYSMYRWISSSTDERARRDGQWVLMVYAIFALGILICIFNALTGVFWVLAIWYLVTYGAVNHLNIFMQLSSPENQMIIDNVFDIIAVLDAKGMITRLNRRGFQLSGHSFFSVNGKGVETIFVHPELTEDTRIVWLEKHGAPDTGIGLHRTSSLDGSLTTDYGEEIPVDLRIISLVNLDKKITGYVISATDMRMTLQLMKEISDREYATRELALSESKFSRMFVFNPTGILIINLKTLKISDANPAIEEILECESKTLVGKTLAEIGFEMKEMPFDVFIEKIVMEGTVSEFGATVMLGSNRKRKCHLSAVSFDMKETGHILLSVVDVTHHENLSDALAKKQKVETIGLLAGGIAHDFNNILAVILGHIGLAKMRTKENHARIPIEKAEQACLRAREITGQLLVFSRGGKPIVSRCDTREVIVEPAMVTINDTSVSCLFDIEKDILPLSADRIQIGQVISNMVGNAAQAMNNMGIIEIHARNKDIRNISAQKRPLGLDMKPLAPGVYIEIIIKDHGPGISADVRTKIFDPFYTTKEKGTGLGLAIVFSIVQNHKGTVFVDSGEEEGARFTILLPADTSENCAETVVPDIPDKIEFHENKTVLIMDDDPFVRESAAGMLASFGYRVFEASEGKSAVRMYQKALKENAPFSFCILDLIIHGGTSGLECAKKILEIDSSAFLLVSSGYSDDPVLSHFADYGFRGVIPKPYTLDELHKILSHLLVL